MDDFIIDVRNREDVEIHDVTQNNRKLLLEFILNKIPVFLNALQEIISIAA